MRSEECFLAHHHIYEELRTEFCSALNVLHAFIEAIMMAHYDDNTCCRIVKAGSIHESSESEPYSCA